MTALLNILRLIIPLLPVVVELVRTIEQVAPLKGVGAQKLELLKGILADAYQALASEEKKTINLERLLLAAASIANRVVVLLQRRQRICEKQFLKCKRQKAKAKSFCGLGVRSRSCPMSENARIKPAGDGLGAGLAVHARRLAG